MVGELCVRDNAAEVVDEARGAGLSRAIACQPMTWCSIQRSAVVHHQRPMTVARPMTPKPLEGVPAY
jgi:hypothetical protein